MKVTIVTSDGDYVRVRQMPDESVAEMLDGYREGVGVLTITLDDVSVTHISVDHIVRIDVDPEDPEGWFVAMLRRYWAPKEAKR